MPDWLWKQIKKFLPPPKWHPLGCYRQGNDPRKVMDAIFLVMRTGMQWNALKATGLCSSSSAHRRFQEWAEAKVFFKLWKAGLLEYDKLKSIDWSWLAMDGAMTKAPLGGEKNRSQSHRPRQGGNQEKSSGRGQGNSLGRAGGGGQPPRRQTGSTHAGIPGHPTPQTHPQKPSGTLFGQRLRLGRNTWAIS